MEKPLRFLKAFLFLVLCSMAPWLAMAQNHVLKGTINDTQGNPLPGVSVVIRGINQGTTTAPDGSFSLTLHGAGAVLEISFLGFDKQAIPVKNQNTIAITLQESKSELKEVVGVGYGTQKKSDITLPISSFKNK